MEQSELKARIRPRADFPLWERTQRPSPSVTQPPGVWQHDLFEASKSRSGHKVLVSNLHYDVSSEDLRDIFQMVGRVRNAEVNFDRTGRSKGTGEVVFDSASDAERAVLQYNDAKCKGMPIRLDLVGASHLSSLAFRLFGTALLTCPWICYRRWSSPSRGGTCDQGCGHPAACTSLFSTEEEVGGKDLDHRPL